MRIGKLIGGSSEWLIEEAGYVKEIKFYDAQGVWYTHDAGWLEHNEKPDQYGHAKRVAFVELPGELKKRIKLETGLEKRENFYMKKKSAYSFEKDGVTLYVYMQKVSPDTVQSGENDLRTEYVKRYTLRLKGVCDDSTPLDAIMVVARGGGIHRLTPFGELVKKMDDMFSLDGIAVTGSDVAELLRLYNVTRKVPVENVVKDEDTGRVLREFTDAEIAWMEDERMIHRKRTHSTPAENVFFLSTSWKSGKTDYIEAMQKALNARFQG